MKNPSKFLVTWIGFQAVNGNSVINFPVSSKTYDLIYFLVKIRIKNVRDETIKNILNQSLNNVNLDDVYLKMLLEDDFHDEN